MRLEGKSERTREGENGAYRVSGILICFTVKLLLLSLLFLLFYSA